MRKQRGIEVSSKDSIYDVTKEYFQLKRSSFVCIVGIFPMNFLVDSADRVPIAYFEF